MQRRCLNCFNLFDIVYSDKEEREVCPYCGYCEGTPPKELYHLYPGVGLYNNRYVIGTCIGFGGFGITYKAWDNVLETVVAVKEYYPTGLVQRVPGKPQVIIYTGESKEEYMQGLERFLDEAKNMAKFVDNPNIVHVDAFFEENNTAYLVMEYLPGMTLKSYLKSKGGRIGCEEVIPIADAVITALKEIHAGGIIHRDISPDNIMLCNDGRIKLLDFGAARFSDADQERTRSIILKPGFAPPEQYQAKSKQGPWTDIYALCATVYRAITGVLPDESVNRVIEDTVQSPIQIYSDIPERISNTVMKGMSIYPEIRFSNVDELKKALDGEKKVMEPKKELRVRRMKRTITVGIALLIVVSMSLYVYNMYKNKKADVVMNSADISIWIAVDDQMNEDGAKAMMDSGIEAFTSSQEKVNVTGKGLLKNKAVLTNRRLYINEHKGIISYAYSRDVVELDEVTGTSIVKRNPIWSLVMAGVWLVVGIISMSITGVAATFLPFLALTLIQAYTYLKLWGNWFVVHFPGGKYTFSIKNISLYEVAEFQRAICALKRKELKYSDM